MYFHTNKIKIMGTGSYAPSRVLKNENIEEKVNTDSNWIYQNLGIKERRIVCEGEMTSDLGTRAGLNAITDSGIDKEDIDLIIVATATPDRKAPSTACIIKNKMGMNNQCPAFDISAVCSGFLYALTIGAQFIHSGMYRNILIIGADTFSKITDWDRRDCVFFGDASGAVVLSRTEDTLFAAQLFADGSGIDSFTVYPDESFFTMNGKEVYTMATDVLPKTISSLLQKVNLDSSDISMIVPHQPSIQILKKTAEILNIPFNKVKINMENYANTSSATIPLLLDELHKDNQLAHGDIILFCAVGAGWTWGSAIYQWGK